MAAIKAGYKKTEIGVIPEDWEVELMSELLSSYHLGGNYPNQYTEGYYPLMKMGNIARSTFDFSKIEYIKENVNPENSHKLQKDDVIFNTRNTLELVGKVAIWKNELPLAYYNSNLLKLNFKQNKINSNAYANYIFNSENTIQRLKKIAIGTTSVAAIYTRDLLKILIPLPPLKEQTAIAAVLSEVDELIESLEQLTNKKRDIKTATMQELLTGKKRLPDFGGKWKKYKIGNFGNCLRGVSYKGTADLSTFYNNNVAILLRSNNIKFARINFSDVQYVKRKCVSNEQYLSENDILICMANGSKKLIGKSGFFHGHKNNKFTFGAFMGCFRTIKDKAIPNYIFYILNSDYFRKQINIFLAGSSINNLTSNAIEKIDFKFPPLKEQTAIANILSDLDAEIEALEERLEKVKNLKTGLMQELLTGKTRLINVSKETQQKQEEL